MDRKQIAKIAAQIATKEDLLDLLNSIKRAETSKGRYSSDSFYPFTMQHLMYYCNPNQTYHRYRHFKIRKKSGGFRLITAPRNQSFRLMLQMLNIVLKSMYTPSPHAMGFIEGKSVVTNAKKHLNQNYVFNIDLKDFFPSIDQARVWKRLQLSPFNFPKEIASVIAGMCAMREIREDSKGKKYRAYVLPQGAPTSPIITNMVCDKLDRRLSGLAKRFGLNYSRYADDITFSSMHNVYSPKGEFRKELNRIITDQGFIVNDSKTRLQKKGGRQEVTGIIVNNKPNVPQKYVRDIRNILYIWDRYGYVTAKYKFLPKYYSEKGHIKKNTPNLLYVINGRLMYLKMVKGESDSAFIRLNEKFEYLVQRDLSLEKTNSNDTIIYKTYPLLDFERKNKISIKFIIDADQRYAVFTLGEHLCRASIKKELSILNEEVKKTLAISFCRNQNGEEFWLIHSLSKIKYSPTITGGNTDDSTERLISDIDRKLEILLDG